MSRFKGVDYKIFYTYFVTVEKGMEGVWFKSVYVLRKTIWIPSLVWEVSSDCWRVGGVFGILDGRHGAAGARSFRSQKSNFIIGWLTREGRVHDRRSVSKYFRGTSPKIHVIRIDTYYDTYYDTPIRGLFITFM